jgi:hypothetical protein
MNERNPAEEERIDDLGISLVRGDAVFRLGQRIGLIPPNGLGVGRRALLLAAVTWLPIAGWAALAGRALPGIVDEPLLRHFGIHVRCLVAIPLLVLAEAMAHAVTTRLVPHFVTSGLVKDGDHDAFRQVLRGVMRLRDSARPWIWIVGAVLAWTILRPVSLDPHEVVWASETGGSMFGFGGWWFLYVARPIYLALLLSWVWRLALLFLLLRRIGALDLSIVPTHPDRAGGLGFLEGIPAAFSLAILAGAAVLASRWAHDVVYHGVHVQSLRVPAIAFLVLNLVAFLSPLIAFAPKLVQVKRRALLEYGSLVGEHGRLVRRRWIQREAVTRDDLLSAPEIGPVADTLALYEAVAKLRPAPIGVRALLAVLLPAAIPFLAVFAIEIPIGELLMKILSTLA